MRMFDARIRESQAALGVATKSTVSVEA